MDSVVFDLSFALPTEGAEVTEVSVTIHRMTKVSMVLYFSESKETILRLINLGKGLWKVEEFVSPRALEKKKPHERARFTDF